jgi:ABC-type multidrug transport system fused ATPase/permease subunit
MVGYLSKVLYILTGSRQQFVWLLFCFTVSSVLETLGIGLIGPFIGLASQPEAVRKVPSFDWLYLRLGLNSPEQFVFLIGIAIVALFFIKSLIYFLTKTYVYYFCASQSKGLEHRLLSAYLSASYTFLLGLNSANIIRNIVVESAKFSQGCLLPLLTASSSLINAVLLMSLLAKTDIKLLFTILGVILVIFLFFQRFGQSLRRWGQVKTEANQEMIRIVHHSFGGLKETRIIGCEDYFERQMLRAGGLFAKASTLFQSSQLLPRVLIESALICVVILYISLSLVNAERGAQNLTAVVGIFAVASIRIIPASSQFIQALGSMRDTSYALDMLYVDLKNIERKGLGKVRDPQVGFSIGKQSVTARNEYSRNTLPFEHRIDLSHVTYQYPNTSAPAIDDLTLRIEKGQSIALIGKSGAGKTTLVDVLLGLLHPESGDISVDGLSIYDGELRSWQNLVAYIPQSIFLMDDTVERNIAFGIEDDSIDSERLQDAIQAAQLEELVEQLSDGVKTEVGERGIRLSGGQRQRIGIARALYHQREILVLDEATSALDTETEQLVSQSIQGLSGTKTLIIIAHRLSTVEHCDRVYLLEKGRVVNSGTYRDVVLQS